MSIEKEKQAEEIKAKNADMLYERRNILDSARMKHSDSLDKYLLSFATGSLYLSILFTNSIEGSLDSKCLLSVGWIMLLLSMISVLGSLYCGEKAHARQMEINDEYINALENDNITVCLHNGWNTGIENMKLISIFSFILGVSFLTYFYFINL